MAVVNPPLFNSEMIREKARGGERGIQNISSSSSCPVFASFSKPKGFTGSSRGCNPELIQPRNKDLQRERDRVSTIRSCLQTAPPRITLLQTPDAASALFSDATPNGICGIEPTTFCLPSECVKHDNVVGEVPLVRGGWSVRATDGLGRSDIPTLTCGE